MVSLLHSLRPWLAGLLAVSFFLAPATSAELVQITGLRTVPLASAEKWIESQLEFVESSGVSMARADDLAFFLENSLRDRGFRRATVEWEIIEGSGGKVIQLTVEEGNAQQISSIRIEGNQAVEAPAIEELILAATRKRLNLSPRDPVPHVANDIKAGTARILELYRLMGYGEVSVEVRNDPATQGSVLFVEVTEGPLHYIANVELPEAPNSEVAAKFRALPADYVGKPLTQAALSSLKSEITEAAVASGFYRADIEVFQVDDVALAVANPVSAVRGIGGRKPDGSIEFPGDGKYVDLVATADWGEVVTVDKVRIRGNEKINQQFFDRHFHGTAGSAYSPNATNENVEELLRTGAFESVRTELVEDPERGTVLEVDVEEGSARTLGIYGGFATYEGPIAGFEFQNLNLFGSVRRIDSSVEASRRGVRGEIQYVDPWFLCSAYELRGGLFALNRSEEGYERFTTGARYSLSRNIGARKRDRLSFFGESAYTDVYDAEIDETLLGEREYFSSLFGVSLSIDRRDKPVGTREGWKADGSVGIAGDVLGSEVEYFRATTGFAYYHPVGNQTFRLQARAGIVQPLGNQGALPIDLRFFNGGRTSVRSFQEREMGRIDPSSGHPVGGEFFTVISAEYDFPIKPLKGLSLVPFFDAGNLLPDAGDAGFSDMKYAAGLGLHYLTPIGPLRFDYGHSLNQEAGESSGVIHVGFGSGF